MTWYGLRRSPRLLGSLGPGAQTGPPAGLSFSGKPRTSRRRPSREDRGAWPALGFSAAGAPITMLNVVAPIVARWLGWSAPNLSQAEALKLWDIVEIGLGGCLI